MMKETKTNTLLLTVIGVATLLVAVIGATFAYFTATLSGTETATTVTVGAGTLRIAYDSGSGALVADDIVPEPTGTAAITKQFTVTGNNTTTSIMPYSVGITVQSNTFTSNALTYTLASTNTCGAAQGVTVGSINVATGIPTGANSITLGSGYFIGTVTNCVHTYELKIFFEDTGENQDIDKNKTFTGYVNTTVQSAYTTTT